MSEHASPPAEPSAEEIVAEAQRRIAERSQKPGAILNAGDDDPGNGAGKTGNPKAQERQLRRANHAVFWLSKHWLALFNSLLALFTALAFVAPILMHTGHVESGALIHRLYAPFCHQYPFRSWFLFGPQATYPTDGTLTPSEMLALGDFVGDAATGFKTALCQRCVAIYGGMALAGMVYSVLRRRLALKPLPVWAYVAFGIAPMAFDGGFQWITYIVHWILPGLQIAPQETTPFFRTLTGGLFGVGSAALLYPHMQVFFDEAYETLAKRYGWR